MTRSVNNRWLHRFAFVTAFVTLGLICVGGLVTSHEAGLAVPDWPTTYGYNMFLFPPSYWVGGILYEHSHRLLASLVGFLTTVLAVWLWMKESRRWLRWTGIGAFFGVIVQGLLGGLRVTLFKDEIGIFHALLAQSFLVVVSFIALATSPWWNQMVKEERTIQMPANLRVLSLAAVGCIFLQLVLGATMRHQHSGLAVPDFPLAYGELWPRTDAAFVEGVNRNRVESERFKAITPTQIRLHMVHRIGAYVSLLVVFVLAGKTCRQLGARSGYARWMIGWAALIFGQAALGAFTVLSNKAADVATAHVMTGAVSLVMGCLLTIAAFRFRSFAETVVAARTRSASSSVPAFNRAVI
jgi:heme a synthase